MEALRAALRRWTGLIGVGLVSGFGAGFGVGCAYHVHIEVSPGDGVIVLSDGQSLAAPADHLFRYRPFLGRPEDVVIVEAPGYRPMQIDVRDRAMHGRHYVRDLFTRPRVVFGKKPRAVVRVVLVPEHGPAGTW